MASECLPPRPAGDRRLRTAVYQAVGVLAVAGLSAGVGVWGLDRYVRQEQGLLHLSAHGAEFARLAAMDFELPDVRTGELVTRSDPQGRPVVLFFGSFTCPRLTDRIPEIRAMYERYEGRVAFRLVYIREPYHENPDLDAFLACNNLGANDRVCAGLDLYGIEFPCLLDEGGRMETAYRAYPARSFLFDGSGDMLWASPPSLTHPDGLDVKQTEAQLEEYLERGSL